MINYCTTYFINSTIRVQLTIGFGILIALTLISHFQSGFTHWTFYILGLMVACAVFLGRLIIRSVALPLQSGCKILNAIAHGDMTHSVLTEWTTRSDVVGDFACALGTLSSQLKERVATMTQFSRHLNAATAETTQSGATLVQCTKDHTARLEEITARMEQLANTVQRNADFINQACQLADATSHQAEEGEQVVAHAANAINAVYASSQKVVDIIGVIEEIAFQINLMSLNAALEATLAGEHGRRFATVVEEVRKLAQRSANVAKEVKGIATESVSKVEDSRQSVERAGQMLHEITLSANQFNTTVADMTAALRTQTTKTDQANQVMLKLHQATQKHIALVEQTAIAIQSTHEQARKLQNIVELFKVNTTGGTRST